jgi:putrescine aminotransferase
LENNLNKHQWIDAFSSHVSSGKAAFFKKYRMDFVMGQREGIYLSDLDGNKKLINLHCNGGVFNLGHRNQELINLLKQSLDELDIGNHHLMSTERAMLAGKMAEKMPGDLSYTIFGVSGGEAVDVSIKIARAYTGREKIISIFGGYHGHTGLALAAGDLKYREPFGKPAPGFIQVPFNDIEAMRGHIDHQTAAVILETIPATLGMAIPGKDYLAAIRKLCDEQGALLILDEVQSGLGRTGKLWAFEHYEIMPDIVIIGKGLSGGLYPITATVIRKPLEQVFHKDPFIHISTFGGAEPGCRVASRVLDISSDSLFLKHVNELAELFKAGIGTLIEKHNGYLKGLRQVGLMMGLELKDDIAGPLLTKTAYDNGLLIIYANNDTSVCQFLPPLVMEKDQVQVVLNLLDKSISDAKRLHPLLKMKRKIEKWIKPLTG